MKEKVAEYFRDKRVLITGAASGIGAELAKEMLEAGATVRISDLNKERLEQSAQRMSAFGERVSYDQADVSNKEQVDRMVQKMAADYDGFDMIVNNAGVFDQQPIEEIPIERMRKVMDINVWGTLYGCYAALPIFLGQGHGHIVNTASLAGIVPTPFKAAYGMSKSAVLSFSDTLRYEMELRGIDVSTICPGDVQTGLFLNSIEITRPVMHRTITQSDNPAAKTIMGDNSGEDFTTSSMGLVFASVTFACGEIMQGIAEKQPIIVTPREFVCERFHLGQCFPYYTNPAVREPYRKAAQAMRECVVRTGNIFGFAELNNLKE